MANDIKTRPQGYQSQAFDNDEQRKEWEARALKVAKIIYKQITAAPADIWQSWAMARRCKSTRAYFATTWRTL